MDEKDEISPREKVYKENIIGYSESVLKILSGRKLSEQERKTMLETGIFAGTRAIESNASIFDALRESDAGKKIEITYTLLGIKPVEYRKVKTHAYEISEITGMKSEVIQGYISGLNKEQKEAAVKYATDNRDGFNLRDFGSFCSELRSELV